MKWIKLWPDYIINGTTFSELNAEERGVWFSLLALAGYSPEPGTICVAKGIPYTDEQIAGILKIEIEVLKRALETLVNNRVNKVVINSDKTISILNWPKYQSEYSEKDRLDSLMNRKRYMRDYMRKHRKANSKQAKNRDNCYGEEVEREEDIEINNNTPPYIPPQENPKKQKAKKPKKAVSDMPADFKLTPEMREYALSRDMVNPDLEFEAFCSHHRAKGNRMADWTAAWRTWALNQQKWSKEKKTGPPSKDDWASVRKTVEGAL